MATLFEAGYLSRVIGLRLVDGRQVVLKLRQPATRLTACMAVQGHLWRAGFPCPEPLAGPAPLGCLTATAETFLPGGERRPASAAKLPELFAGALAELVRKAPVTAAAGTLDPLPWFGFGWGGPRLWPTQMTLPDGRRPRDLNAGPIPWLDEAGRRARARLEAARLELVVGHGDWHTGNVHWDGETLHAVHDWDSVVCAPEAAIAGAAATGFAETEVTPGATIEQAEAFLQAYGRSWTAEEREVAWAAGLWLLAFNAKVELLRGRLDRTVPHLRRELDERLRLAGA